MISLVKQKLISKLSNLYKKIRFELSTVLRKEIKTTIKPVHHQAMRVAGGAFKDIVQTKAIQLISGYDIRNSRNVFNILALLYFYTKTESCWYYIIHDGATPNCNIKKIDSKRKKLNHRLVTWAKNDNNVNKKIGFFPSG